MNLREWVEKYKPLRTDNGDVIALETYGKFMDYVNKQDITRVWTSGEEDGGSYISAGKRWVNRLNYFITEIPWEDGNEYVSLDDDDDIDIYYTM